MWWFLPISIIGIIQPVVWAQQHYPSGLNAQSVKHPKQKYPPEPQERKREENIYTKEHTNTPPPVYQEQRESYSYDHRGQVDSPKLPTYEDAGGLLTPIRRVDDTEVTCHKNYMTVSFKFSSPFNGFIYPYQQFPHCILFTGHQSHDTEIVLYHGHCGKKFIKDESDPEFSPIIEHRLNIQWERDFVCEDDSSVIVRCDRPDDFNKTVAWNFETLNFSPTLEQSTHPGPKMWMEIQRGVGPGAPSLDAEEKPVFVGDDLTLIFTLSDDVFWFDSNILACKAVEGGGEIEKIEWEGEKSQTAVGYTGQMAVVEDACSVKPKIFSHFFKEKVTKDGQLITLHYAYFKAFRFPTSLKVIIQCDVEVCYKECSVLPSCKTAFQPRSIAKERKRREIAGGNELDRVDMFRTLHIYGTDDGVSFKEVPLVRPSDKIVIKDCFGGCFPSTTFYIWVGALSFIICCLCAVLVYVNRPKKMPDN